MAIGFLATVLVTAACGVADEGTLPPEVQDPVTLKTPSGAIARYRGAVTEFASMFDGVLFVGGTLTDELMALPIPVGTNASFTGLDSRIDLAGVSLQQSLRLHRTRAQAREARGFLGAYAPDSSPALRGHMYALEAYAEIFLADLFCSGIPLSRVDFDGDYVLAPASTTSEVYRHSVALLDSARALAEDSIRLQQLAAVGLGRAYLALGIYDSAAAAVATVPDNYKYDITFSHSVNSANVLSLPDSAAFWWFATRVTPNATPTTTQANTTNTLLAGAPSMADQEGGVGLNYRSSADPRTIAQARGRAPLGQSFFFPRKYVVTANVTLPVANGIEARLIEAEAAFRLNPGDGIWLQKLNQLRQTAWTTIVPAVSGPLPDLTDPGSDDVRVNLLFRERAFWLYLTAHRQGDLRRLVRQYLRTPESVYPAGSYLGGGGVYGAEVVVPAPPEEQNLNPLYTGCLHRSA